MDIGEIIATRIYRFFDEDNNERAVSILVGKPEPAQGSPDYQCPFQLIALAAKSPR
jgi:hypothetical protein